jgi:hypothetical protein
MRKEGDSQAVCGAGGARPAGERQTVVYEDPPDRTGAIIALLGGT